MRNGQWLLSFATTVTLGATTFEPADVATFDGTAYTMFFDASTFGVPSGSNVDAAFLVGGDAGDLVVSFDAPTRLGAVEYLPADLARFHLGTFSKHFDSALTAPPIPLASNITGADQRSAATAFTVDVPTTLSASTFLPGQIATWNGSSFSLVHSDASWPTSSTMAAFSYVPSPGDVGASLRVNKGPSNRLVVTWASQCPSSGANAGIFEGQIGSWSSHTAVDCDDAGGDQSEQITPGSGNRYYLVVPFKGTDEGSYGRNSAGVERPAGATTCAPMQAAGGCS
jgi:hypothetical protein